MPYVRFKTRSNGLDASDAYATRSLWIVPTVPFSRTTSQHTLFRMRPRKTRLRGRPFASGLRVTPGGDNRRIEDRVNDTSTASGRLPPGLYEWKVLVVSSSLNLAFLIIYVQFHPFFYFGKTPKNRGEKCLGRKTHGDCGMSAREPWCLPCAHRRRVTASRFVYITFLLWTIVLRRSSMEHFTCSRIVVRGANGGFGSQAIQQVAPLYRSSWIGAPYRDAVALPPPSLVQYVSPSANTNASYSAAHMPIVFDKFSTKAGM